MKVIQLNLRGINLPFDEEDLNTLVQGKGMLLNVNGKEVNLEVAFKGFDTACGTPHFETSTVQLELDIYPKEKESIFDNPRWVTVKGKDGDTTSFFGYQLICGKDYKVVNQSEGRYNIQLTYTKIIEVSKEYFHKVTPADLKPVVGIPDEDSFDNLKYIKPEVDCRIKIEKLSDEQKRFLNESLVWEDDDRFLTLCSSEFKNLRYCSTDKTWWLSTCGDECSEQDINFNQIFQGGTTHQD